MASNEKEMNIFVPDRTLGLKRYRTRGAIMAGAKQWFLRLVYFLLSAQKSASYAFVVYIVLLSRVSRG